MTNINKAQIIIGADNQAGPGIKQAEKDLRGLGNAADRSGKRTKESFRQAEVSSNSLSGSISRLYASMAGLMALVGAGAIARGFIETAAAMERTELMLTGLEGSSEKARESMTWIIDFAGKAPYDLAALSDTFVKLRVSGLDPTAGSMQSLVDAVAAFGGSNEQLQRASVAIMQMAGKGVISMEELRQQLGEAVPDAIHVMAREMNMSVRDLTDQISKGAIDATTGLTALFEGWKKDHQGAAETFAGSMSGLWNQLSLQYELFKYDLMNSEDSFIYLKAALKTTLDLVKKWREDKSLEDWSDRVVKSFGVVVEGAYWVGKAFAGWHIIWEGVKMAWDATTAAIWKSISWLADKIGILLEKLASVQEFLNFDAQAANTRAAASGMRDWADQLSRATDLLVDDIATKGVKGLEDAVSAADGLRDKFDALKQTFADNVQAMKDHASAAKSTAGEAASAVSSATEKSRKELEELQAKLAKSYETLHDFLAIHSEADESARRIAALNIEYEKMADQLSELQDAGFDVVEMSEQLEQWYSNSMDAIQDKTEKTTDTIYDTWVHAYERLQDITADWIYNMKVDFDSLVDLFKRSVAQMVSAWIWGQGNMQFMSGGTGGFSLSGMLGSLFGGGTAQPGDSNFIGPLRPQDVAGSGIKAMLGSYLGEGVLANAGWFTAALLASYYGGGLLGNALFDMSGYNTNPEYANYGGLGGFLLGGNPFTSALGAIFGGWLGSNKKRSYLGREYTFGDYSAESGWGIPEMEQYYSKRKGSRYFGDAADQMAQSASSLLNSLDSAFKSLLGMFGDSWVNQFTASMGMMAAESPSFKFYISAEDEGEFKEDWLNSWRDFTSNLIDPMVEAGSDLLRQALEGTVSDSMAWNYFSDEMKDYLSASLEASLAGLDIDWSQVTDQESFDEAIEQMNLSAEQLKGIIDHFETMNEILGEISDSVEMHDFSDAAKEAIMTLRDLNREFDAYRETLEALGVDMEKYTDLEKARLYAIQDSIEAMMEAGISSADLTMAIERMADEMTAAGHSLEEVTAAVTAAWLAAADAASTHIADSYGAAMEQIRTAMMSDQQLFDYYSSQVAQLEQSLSSLTDPAEIQQTMDDILRYTMLAWGMLSPEQQQIYGPQFIQDLQENQEAANNLLDRYRDSLRTTEERLLDMIEKLITGLFEMAGIQKIAADTQMEAGKMQIAAAGMPANVAINLVSGDVG